MQRKDVIEQWVQQASALLKNQELGQEMESRLRSIAQGAFNRMDVVSREEFDAQSAVLLRTRQKLESMEAELQDLQQVIAAADGKS